jgi:hypothetical protein
MFPYVPIVVIEGQGTFEKDLFVSADKENANHIGTWETC